jgi:hypothetical protein
MKKININVLKCISDIAKKLGNSELMFTADNSTNVNIVHLKNYMQVTETQALLFVAIFAAQNQRFGDVNIKGISDFLKMDFFDILNYKSDFDTLLERRLILEPEFFNNRRRSKSFSRIEFEVSEEVLLSIYDNVPLEINDKKLGLDVYGFVDAVSKLIVNRSDEFFDTFKLLSEMEKLESANPKIHLVEQLMFLNIDKSERLFFYEICKDFLSENYTDVHRTLTDIYDHPRYRFSKLRLFKEAKSTLHELDLVSNVEGSFMNEFKMRLTNRGLEIFLQEDAKDFLDKQKSREMILPTSINAKTLYFEPDMQQQINFLSQTLEDEQYTKLTERLKEKTMPTGINCIFYGEPGTGKTESAMQIAKATGRSVFMVDISNTKSMWFGESEKTVRDIFNRYRKACKLCELKPILLFNEADAVFSKRKEVNASNLAQTENAIQNIILEEMERMDGILIATTNLAENIDSAFDRRFLFKLRFEKPTKEMKMAIWKDKINWITDDAATELATKFDFSGGEIDNVARKVITHELLTGIRPTAAEIFGFCNGEKFALRNKRSTVGF